MDDVFNQYTVEAVLELMNRGIVGEIHGPVAQGKEAKVIWAESPRGEDLALKIFYTSTAQFIRGRQKYLMGDPRFTGFRASDTRKIAEAWCRKEFGNLKRAHEAGVRVPKPIAFYRNVLAMEFISYGNERGVPAPTMKDEPPSDPWEAYLVILNYVERALVLGEIVHADLSEYNVLNNGEELVIIDWGSAVKTSHPQAMEFLARDLANLNKYFNKELGVDVVNEELLLETLLNRAREARGGVVEGEGGGWLVIGGKTLPEALGIG